MVKWPDGPVTRWPEWLFVEKLPQSCIVRIATNADFCSVVKAIHALKNEMRWKPGSIKERK